MGCVWDIIGSETGSSSGREDVELCVLWIKLHLWPLSPQETGWAGQYHGEMKEFIL